MMSPKQQRRAELRDGKQHDDQQHTQYEALSRYHHPTIPVGV
jgi:hypothetical protein